MEEEKEEDRCVEFDDKDKLGNQGLSTGVIHLVNLRLPHSPPPPPPFLPRGDELEREKRVL